MLESHAICRSSRARAPASSSPGRGSGRMRWARNSSTSNLTSSTSAKRRPGQLRAPPDQPTKGPPVLGGSRSVSAASVAAISPGRRPFAVPAGFRAPSPLPLRRWIQRAGRKSSESSL